MVAGSDDPPTLLERDDVLAEIAGAIERGRAGSGSVVAIEGVAGVGKSALVDAVRRGVDSHTVVVAGGCDDLSIPHPLGPFVDAIGSAHLTSDDLVTADSLRGALRSLLDRSPFTLVVIEDIHWADAATLDVVAHVIRRIEGERCVVLLTFRPQPDLLSPVRRTLASAPARAVRQIRLDTLSLDAVAVIVDSVDGLDPSTVYDATGGNPFLVVEMARSPGVVPDAVRNSAASRLATRSAVARELAATLSVVPMTTPWPVVELIEPDWRDPVEELEASSIMRADAGGLAFVHDLVRRAVEAGLSDARRRANHRLLVDALHAAGEHAAQIAHHASELGDVDLLVESSVDACAAAAASGAHVEALAHVERMLPHADRLSTVDRRHVFTVASHEYSLNHRLEEALDYAQRCVTMSRTPSERSEALAWLSLVEWWTGDFDRSRQHLEDSVAALGGDSPPTDLLRRIATDLAHRSRWTEAWTWAMRALGQAERDGDASGLARSLSAAEMVGAVIDDPTLARQRGDRAIEIYRREGLQRDLWINVGNRVASDINNLRIDDCAAAVDAAVALDKQLDVASFHSWLTAQRAFYHLYVGQWDEARTLADRALSLMPDGMHRATPQLVLSLLDARSTATPVDPLGEVADLIGYSDDIQRVGNLAVAIAEFAWLGADVDRSWIDHATRLAADSGHPRYVADLEIWRRRLGPGSIDVAGAGPPPLMAELAGDWTRAAREWELLGCPYERALTLAFSGDADAMREALHVVADLGAARTADRIRQMLRDRGIRSNRGPRASTRRNVAGLTARQLEVADLLAEGLSDAEIAGRLFITLKTVGHHVSAVLSKLGVARRHEVGPALLGNDTDDTR